jgi:positive regulator of sigma E activity
MGMEGIVQSIKGNVVFIQIQNPVNCHSAEGCSSGNCCSAKTITFKALKDEHLGVHEGDYVKLESPRGKPLSAFLTFFGLPILAGVVCFLVLNPYFSPTVSSLISVALSLTAMVIPALFIKSESNLPRIIQVIPAISLKK